MNDGHGPHSEGVLPTVGAWRDAINTSFSVEVVADNAVEMTLVAVDDAKAPPGWEAFSLLFAGPDEPLPQATYPVRHPRLGSFPLFVGSVASDGGEHRYEAIFNRSAT